MALSWRMRRQLLYYVVVGILGAFILLTLYISVFSRQATCSDGSKNGGEAGVDCGGACSLVCAESARAPRVLWTRAFRTTTGTYTVAAYVENLNTGAGAKNVPYAFQLFDDKGAFVVERRSTIDLPPVLTVPIIQTNIDVGSRMVARALITFDRMPEWHIIGENILPALRLSNQTLAQDGSRLSTTISNSSLEDAHDVVVVAVLFDSTGAARAASQSFVASIPRKGSQNIVFTWPGTIEGIVRAEVTILPPF